MTQRSDSVSAAERIEAALTAFAALPDPRALEQAEDLVRTLMDFYDAGLSRLVELIDDAPGGDDELRRLATDPTVAGLLILHDLHPADTAERVAAALERVRPYLGSHSGDVEFLGVGDDNVVRLRLAGSCNGCPSSSITVTTAIEQAIEEAAPEVVRVDVEGVAPAPRSGGGGPGGRRLLPVIGGPGAVPSLPLTTPAAPAATWVPLADPAGYAPGTLAGAILGGAATVVANLDGTLYAYHDRCPACGSTLRTGVLDGDTLTCAGCVQRFDLRRAGAGLDDVTAYLSPLPLLADDGSVRVAVPSGAPR
jgi:Fe-S cluster biogenesis protein NfuA/nitrite reductase/ring-hydroxylating ferredoxin subunit